MNDFHYNSLKKALEKKKSLLTTRKAKSLQSPLYRAVFDIVSKPISASKGIRLYNRQDKRCFLHCCNYINPCKEFIFKLKSGRYYVWKYNHYFDCKSSNAIYLIICINCEGTYIGEIKHLLERMNNTKSSIGHANASSLPYTQRITKCRNLKEPLFNVYPFYYESDLMFRLTFY